MVSMVLPNILRAMTRPSENVCYMTEMEIPLIVKMSIFCDYCEEQLKQSFFFYFLAHKP